MWKLLVWSVPAVVVAVLLPSSLLTAEPPPAPVKPELPDLASHKSVDGLLLTLSAEQREIALVAEGDRIQPRELLTCKLTFTNVSKQDLKLNAYALTNVAYTMDTMLSVSGPDGKPARRQPVPPAPPRPPTAESFKILKPQESWTHVFRFPTAGYLLEAIGQYTVKATYRGSEDTAPHPEPAFTKGSWTGTVASNEIVFTVKWSEDGKRKAE